VGGCLKLPFPPAATVSGMESYTLGKTRFLEHPPPPLPLLQTLMKPLTELHIQLCAGNGQKYELTGHFR